MNVKDWKRCIDVISNSSPKIKIDILLRRLQMKVQRECETLGV